MARSAAAKKVARAASTGAGGKGVKRTRNRTFTWAMAGVLMLGVVAVLFARQERADDFAAANPDWWLHYSFYECDRFLDESFDERTGDDVLVAARGDNLILVKPATQEAGSAPTLGLFMSASGGAISDTGLLLPSGRAVEEGGITCAHPYDTGGERGAELKVLLWNRHDAPSPVEYRENLGERRLAGTGQLVVMAMVHPELRTEDIPRPDATELLEVFGIEAPVDDSDPEPPVAPTEPVEPTEPTDQPADEPAATTVVGPVPPTTEG